MNQATLDAFFHGYGILAVCLTLFWGFVFAYNVLLGWITRRRAAAKQAECDIRVALLERDAARTTSGEARAEMLRWKECSNSFERMWKTVTETLEKVRAELAGVKEELDSESKLHERSLDAALQIENKNTELKEALKYQQALVDAWQKRCEKTQDELKAEQEAHLVSAEQFSRMMQQAHRLGKQLEFITERRDHWRTRCRELAEKLRSKIPNPL